MVRLHHAARASRPSGAFVPSRVATLARRRRPKRPSTRRGHSHGLLGSRLGQPHQSVPGMCACTAAVAPSVSRRPFRFTCERRCPPLSPSYQAPPWRTLISTAALPPPPPPAAKWRWRAGSRRPSAAPLGTTACTRFPSTRFEFCLFPSLGPTRRPSPRPQVPWDYAQAGFSHGPKGMWRDEFLTENAVRRYLLPTN